MRWTLLFATWLCYFSFGLSAASLAPLVALIEADLGISHSAMGSVLGIWQLVYIGAAVPCGVFLDRAGPRAALLVGVLLVAVSTAGRAFADSWLALMFAVGLFGIGGPIVSSGAPKVVGSIFQGGQRGLAMGIYMTGPTLGGVVALTGSHSLLLPLFDGDWRPVLLVWSVIALIAGAVWWVVAGIAGPRTSGFQLGGDAASAGAGLGTGSGDAIRAILFLPAVPVVLLMGVGAFLFNHGLNNWLPELLRASGMSAIAASNWAALPMVVGIIGSLTIPRLATPGRRVAVLVVLCLCGAAASVMLLVAREPLGLTAALVLQGVIRSALMTVLILTLMELPGLAARHAGTANGLFFSAAEVGGVLGPLGLGALYDLTGNFDAGLYVFAAIMGAMALGSTALARHVDAAPEPAGAVEAAEER